MRCHFCQGELFWSCDYNLEDFGLDGEGIVAVLHCSECNATWEGYLIFDEEVE